MKYLGSTFLGYKLILCACEITVLGHWCTPDSRLPDLMQVEKISNWSTLKDLSDIRTFVGTIGVCHMFIWHFAHWAHHLVKLTWKDMPFEYGPNQVAAQEDLKRALLNSPALQPLHYTSGTSVILSVNTSCIVVSFILGQCNIDNPKLWYFAQFGSITLNDHETWFSQPKLKLYSLYHTLRTLRLYLIGLRNLVVEVDAKFIKGMLANPDIAPSASINHWIVSILMFHFDLVHVPSAFHGPDGLSRRKLQPGDTPEAEDDFNDWVDQVQGFLHMILPISTHCTDQPPTTIHILQSFANDIQAGNEDHKLAQQEALTNSYVLALKSQRTYHLSSQVAWKPQPTREHVRQGIWDVSSLLYWILCIGQLTLA